MISINLSPRARGSRDDLRFAAAPLLRRLVGLAIAQAESGSRRYADDIDVEAGARIDVHIDGEALVEAIRAAAVDGLQRFLDGLDEGLRAIEEQAEAPAPRPRKAKPKAKPRKRRASASSAASA